MSSYSILFDVSVFVTLELRLHAGLWFMHRIFGQVFALRFFGLGLVTLDSQSIA